MRRFDSVKILGSFCSSLFGWFNGRVSIEKFYQVHDFQQLLTNYIIYYREISDLRVEAGISHIDEYNGFESEIVEIIKYPKYDKETYDNDIVLFKVWFLS